MSSVAQTYSNIYAARGSGHPLRAVELQYKGGGLLVKGAVPFLSMVRGEER